MLVIEVSVEVEVAAEVVSVEVEVAAEVVAVEVEVAAEVVAVEVVIVVKNIIVNLSHKFLSRYLLFVYRIILTTSPNCHFRMNISLSHYILFLPWQSLIFYNPEIGFAD
jgi:hypothetical protein